MAQKNKQLSVRVSTALWVLTFAILVWLVREFDGALVQSVLASETAEPSVAETASSQEPVFQQEDAIRARVRRRLEAGPTRELGSTETAATGSDGQAKELFDKLQGQQRELDEKHRQLGIREQSLVEREALVKAQLSRYEETLSRLRTEVDSLRGLKNTKLEEFRKIYSKMESKKAARILDDMDTDMAGQILSSLKESQSADVMGHMDPEKARRITVRFLTGRSFSQNTTR
jgi:flagellar motility protein MotE (MotC chaperone)